MIKVFLAENELSVRDVVKETIDRENEEYEFVGEAADGEEAYKKILKEKPDILITDIELPVKDGFELCRLVKPSLPGMKIIILSEDERFETVRRAIGLGVSDYLKKPFSPKNLLVSLHRVTKKILSERKEKKSQSGHEKARSEEESLRKIGFLNDMLYSLITKDEADSRARELGLTFGKGSYHFLIFRIRKHLEEYNNESRSDEIGDRIRFCTESIFQDGVTYFRNGVDSWILLLRADTDEKCMEKILTLKSSLEKMMSKYPDTDFFGGVGSGTDTIDGLREAFESAEKAFSRRFIEDPCQIIIEETAREIQDKTFSTDNLDKLEYSRVLIERFLVKGTMDDLESFLDFYFQEIPEDNFQSFLMRQYLAVDVFVAINTFYKKNGIERKAEHYVDIFAERIRNVHTAQDMRKVLHKILSDTLARRDEMRGSKYAHAIDWAERYVNLHYMSEDISLNSVADYVNMNPSYFSSVFRKEKGITFVEYLTRVRLERAKELLLCSSLKISEIAYKVGYNDPQYFSHLFKKYNQCSPKDYRQNNRKN